MIDRSVFVRTFPAVVLKSDISVVDTIPVSNPQREFRFTLTPNAIRSDCECLASVVLALFLLNIDAPGTVLPELAEALVPGMDGIPVPVVETETASLKRPVVVKPNCTLLDGLRLTTGLYSCSGLDSGFDSDLVMAPDARFCCLFRP